MNELQIYKNAELGSVRAVVIGGEVYFVGKDVAEILGYTNPSKALSDHVDDEDKLNNESLSSLGQRGGWLINESGLYSLILSSKLPSARKFKRWVTSEAPFHSQTRYVCNGRFDCQSRPCHCGIYGIKARARKNKAAFRNNRSAKSADCGNAAEGIVL